jgi:hypothetical protein
MVGKRFEIPKKFKNTDWVPTANFMKIYYSIGYASNLGTIGFLTHDPPLDLNEPTTAASESPYNGKFKSEMLSDNVKWGTSYSRLSLLGNIRLYKPLVL